MIVDVITLSMPNDLYTISSPKFITKADFDRWPLWCEWHDASELDALRSAGVAQSEIDLLFIEPNAAGREVYYPITSGSLSMIREFTYAKSTLLIGGQHEFFGYLSLTRNEVVAATVYNDDTEIVFLRHDRLLACDENPASVSLLRNLSGIESLTGIDYTSDVTDGRGAPLKGRLSLETDDVIA